MKCLPPLSSTLSLYPFFRSPVIHSFSLSLLQKNMLTQLSPATRASSITHATPHTHTHTPHHTHSHTHHAGTWNDFDKFHKLTVSSKARSRQAKACLGALDDAGGESIAVPIHNPYVIAAMPPCLFKTPFVLFNLDGGLLE